MLCLPYAGFFVDVLVVVLVLKGWLLVVGVVVMVVVDVDIIERSKQLHLWCV